MRVRTFDGQWVVDVIRLTLTGTGHDGEWLRISRWGVHIADVRTVGELTGFVDLADLQAVLARSVSWPGSAHGGLWLAPMMMCVDCAYSRDRADWDGFAAVRH